MTVRELMNKNVIAVSPDETVSLAARLLFRHNIGSVPVCTEDGKIKGIVTDRDITLRCVATDSDPETTPVKEIMTRSIVSAAPEDDIDKAAALMSTAQIRRLPVVDSGKLVGFLALADIARQHSCCIEAAKALSDISLGVRRKLS